MAYMYTRMKYITHVHTHNHYSHVVTFTLADYSLIDCHSSLGYRLCEGILYC